MTNPFLRNTLPVAMLTLVAAAQYYGIVYNAPLPDYLWLHGRTDLALRALAFFALSLPTLVLWPHLKTAIGSADLAGVALGMMVVWGLHRLFRHRLDRLRAQRVRRGTK